MKRLILAGALLVAFAAQVAPASAAPTGEFARFAQCPMSNPAVNACVYAETASGSFKMGSKTVPVKYPVVLQGGATIKETIAETLPLYAAANGQTLTKAAQPVPGGLTGIVAPSWWPTILKNLFNETINNGFTCVTATVELAAPASSVKLNLLSILGGFGTGLVLPVKVKLDNPFLGSSCYIGSNSSPIPLNFTSGTTSPPAPNTPITGSPGEFGAIEEGKITVDKNNKLVDNSFVGVPSAAGTNAAILEGTTYLTGPANVKESE